MLDTATLRQLLDYDRVTGCFRWRSNIGVAEFGRKRNSTRGGQVAGSLNKKGYVTISLLGVKYYAHRLAWLYVHGERPLGQIDHKNGNKSDNRLNNLRLASAPQNQHNRGRNRNNKSGHKGVFWCSLTEKWRAQIGKISLGTFTRRAEAIKSYREAARKLYGDFAKF